jgi:hypothetical protein
VPLYVCYLLVPLELIHTAHVLSNRQSIQFGLFSVQLNKLRINVRIMPLLGSLLIGIIQFERFDRLIFLLSELGNFFSNSPLFCLS